MILRRIKAHVEKENWFAVFVDFLIVVVGVFIGLQVANWNEARTEKGQASDLIERLISESIETRAELARYIEVHEQISNDVTELALTLKNKETCLAKKDRLAVLIVGIADFPPPRFSLSNAKQALDTGSLALIRSNEVQVGIQTISDELSFIEFQWQRYVSGKQYASQEAHKSAGVSLTGNGDMWLESTVVYDPESFELLTPENICGNTENLALVTDASVTQKIYLDYLVQVESALDDYLTTLNSESGQ